MTPRPIVLSTMRPAHVTREPVYRYTPRYGMLTLGEARDHRIVVALDAPEGKGTVRLYVDSNGNGDLTDEKPHVMTPSVPSPVPGNTGDGTQLAGERLTVTVPVIARYNTPGRAGSVESALQFIWWDNELSYNREYHRIGTLNLNGRAYRIALVDQDLSGRFDHFRHDADASPRVTVLIDRDNDGTFDVRREAYDAAKPFRIGARTYTVTHIDARGTQMVLKKSDQKVRGNVSAADLRVGGSAIEFEADLIDGKPVAFPDDYRGKIVLLDFWAIWCPPCREEMPNLVSVYRQYREAGFDVLGVSLDRANSAGTLRAFMREYGMAWPQIYDGGYWNAEIAQLYGVQAIPQAYLVDGDTGRILAMGDELRGSNLARVVEQALAQKRNPGGRR